MSGMAGALPGQRQILDTGQRVGSMMQHKFMWAAASGFSFRRIEVPDSV
jgi:hypothetical protein